MSRKYSAVIDAVSVAAVAEIFAVIAPSDACVAIHEVVVTQDILEISEQLPMIIFRTVTDQSAKGTSVTPAPLESGEPAFGGVVRLNILAAETLATETTPLFRQAQNILGGWHWLWTPETRPILSPSGKLCVKLDAVPSTALTVSGYIVFEEIGG
jgi:hypothetical protein